MRLWTTGERVAALARYNILDTAPEPTFKDIVEIARTLTGAPIALVSLVILSLAQSVADSTLRSAADLPAARAAQANRLQALARAHDLLLQQQWTSASLREVATATLAAAGVEVARAELEGPPVQLGSRAALQLALTFHELTTNAGKYGALSNEAGRVSLLWSVEDGDGASRLRLAWTERGGPPVAPPVRAGFGTRVVGRATEAALGGEVELSYEPAGFRWRLTAPMARLAEGEAA